jgi:antitoxin VapB
MVATYPGRHVKLFRNGKNQAVRIPIEFELDGSNAIMRRENNRLTIELAPPRSLSALLASWTPLQEELPEIVDLPPEDVEL